MNSAIRLLLLPTLVAPMALAGCDIGAAKSDLEVERLPDVDPNLPKVPDLPPPPHPIKYDDDSYSIYGLRARMRDTINTKVEVKGYIVDIYEPPDCDREDPDCTVLAPHMWMADEKDIDTDKREKQLRVVGYANSHEDIEDARKEKKRGTYEPMPGQPAIPTDFKVGNEVKLEGTFKHVSGGGFKSGNGLLQYAGHETLEAVDEDDS
jgi:hypothetical protein